MILVRIEACRMLKILQLLTLGMLANAIFFAERLMCESPGEESAQVFLLPELYVLSFDM